MTVRELHTIEEPIFDETATHPLQSFAWGKIRETTGLPVRRFGAYQGEVLVEIYQMTLHKIPGLPYFVGYVPRSVMPSEAFLKYLQEYCKKYKIISVQFEPNEEAASATHAHPILRVSATPLFYKYTRVIDLSKTAEILKSELEATTRYNVGLAERKGVIVSTQDTEQGFEDFYSLYESTTKRQHFGGHTKKYHKAIWDIFSKQGISHILVAYLGGKPLAACELFLYKGTLYYTYAGSTTEHRNLKAMNALVWHVILFGKEHGASKLDLWGILPPDVTDPKNPWAGFTDFKKGYGGSIVEMAGSYDLVVMPGLYFVYQIGYKLRKILNGWC